MAGLSSPGIGSGLDINAILERLMAFERRPLRQLDVKEGGYQAKLSAYGSLKGALSALQTAVKGIASADKFLALKASSSDETVLTASAANSAALGTYNVIVTQLAKAHKVASDYHASTTALGTGTLTFAFGTYDSGLNTFTANPDKPSKTVTITTANQTPAQIRDAVNTANIGVTASIVNDGTGERLVFSSNDSGVKNSLKITITGDGDGDDTDAAGLSFLAYDPTAAVGAGKNLVETQAVKDLIASIDGISIVKSSNTVTDAISGVTLTFKKEGGATSTLTLSRDKDSARKGVEDFIKAFNDAAKQIKQLTAYDSQTKRAGPLQADSGALSVQNRLRSLLNTELGGTGARTLSDIGVSVEKDGTLKLNSTKLNSVLDTDPTGVAKLFASIGTATDSLVTYQGAGVSTKAGTYGVNITQLATQGQLVADAAAGLTITAGVNDSLTIIVNGTSATVTLGAGTYASASALAAEVQSKLNGTSAFSSAGITIGVTESGGVLTVTSTKYGSTSTVTDASGNGATNLFGGAPTSTAGVNVAGTIGGLSATGDGQVLTATGGDAAGLKVKIIGGSTGDRGAITFTRGYATQLDSLIDELTGSLGPLKSRTDGLDKSIKDIDQRRTALLTRLEAVERRYRAQFTALDTAVARMNQTSNYLNQQLTLLQRQIGSNRR